jgi:hypothetical protein
MTISTSAFLTVNPGASANDGTGDSLRAAFVKVNSNFSNISAVGFTAGNIIATGVTATSLSVSGGITNTGAQIETGYQQYKPVGNIAVTANVNVNRILLHPTGTIISFGANVTLPNTQVNGTIISISSNVTISALAVVTPWVGTTISPYGNTASVISGTVLRFMYIAADYKWYKIA